MTDTRKLIYQHTISVPEHSRGVRLDKWLAEIFPKTSRSRLRGLIEQGFVKNAEILQLDAAYRIKTGQTFIITFPKPDTARPIAQHINLDIVFEDRSLIVVNKPAGMVVHPAPGNPDKTLVNALLAHCGDSLQGIGGVRRPGIVHRIDKGTSGLLVAAKTEEAHTRLAAQFSAHDIDRIYDAFVWGVPKPLKGQITGAIGRSSNNRKKMAVVTKGGKPAETHYTTVSTFGSIAGHIQCSLTTGRTHQIRVHMTSLGYPIIGDSSYGNSQSKLLRSLTATGSDMIKSFPRQALHAASLGFQHPTTGKDLRFESQIPDDMKILRTTLTNETNR
ncbi:MAG: RNA pseudouridine synthase [Candidatus Marinimicrobia bacterium]|nr:RNA pseudouridine synthase [Candidatus Neomarinimicrobiota bacterium]